MSEPKRRGRPKNPPTHQSAVLSMRVNIRVYDRLCRLARARRTSVATIARELLLARLHGLPPTPFTEFL